MRSGKKPLAESSNELSIGIELKECLRAAGEDIQVPLGVERNGGRSPHRDAFRNRKRVRDSNVIQFRRGLRHQKSRIRRPLRQSNRRHEYGENNGGFFHRFLSQAFFEVYSWWAGGYKVADEN